MKKARIISLAINDFAAFGNVAGHLLRTTGENTNRRHLQSTIFPCITWKKKRRKGLTCEWRCLTNWRKAGMSGRPKWLMAFRPVKRLFFDKRWKWFSQTYYNTQKNSLDWSTTLSLCKKDKKNQKRDLPAWSCVNQICGRTAWQKCAFLERGSHRAFRYRGVCRRTIRRVYATDTPTQSRLSCSWNPKND